MGRELHIGWIREEGRGGTLSSTSGSVGTEGWPGHRAVSICIDCVLVSLSICFFLPASPKFLHQILPLPTGYPQSPLPQSYPQSPCFSPSQSFPPAGIISWLQFVGSAARHKLGMIYKGWVGHKRAWVELLPNRFVLIFMGDITVVIESADLPRSCWKN